MAWQKDQNIVGDPKRLARYVIAGGDRAGSPISHFPDIVRHTGAIIYVTNVGSPASETVAVSDGTNWIDLSTGVPIVTTGSRT